MNDAAPVRVVDGACQHLDELGGLVRLPAAQLQLLLQRAALDIFERQKGPAGAVAVIEDLHDVGMLQQRDRSGFALETLQIVRAHVFAREEGLDGDEAVEGGLLRLVDDAHAAPADLIEDLVARQAERRFKSLVSLPTRARGDGMREGRCERGGRQRRRFALQ